MSDEEMCGKWWPCSTAADHSLYRHPPTADVWDRYREFWLSAAPEVIE